MIKKLTYIKIIGLFISICISNLAYSQINTHHVGKNFFVEPHGNVIVVGDLIDTVVSTTPNTISLKNQGLIKLNGDLKNYGTTNLFGGSPDLGRLQVYGTSGHSILGSGQTNLCNLDVNLPLNNLIIGKKTQVNDSLYFINGNVFLSGDTLVLNYFNSTTTSASSGIIGEVDSMRIFGPNFPEHVHEVTSGDHGSTMVNDIDGEHTHTVEECHDGGNGTNTTKMEIEPPNSDDDGDFTIPAAGAHSHTFTGHTGKGSRANGTTELSPSPVAVSYNVRPSAFKLAYIMKL